MSDTDQLGIRLHERADSGRMDPLDAARQAARLVAAGHAALMRASTVAQAKRVRDQAQAIFAYMKQQGDAENAAREAGVLKVRAERRLGELLSRTEMDRGGRPRKGKNRSQAANGLDALGVTKDQSSRWQRVASLPSEIFEAFIAEAEEVTTSGALRLAAGGRLAAFSSSSVEWWTPPRIVEAVRKVLGEIDVDPASSAEANATVRAKKFFDSKEDGLSIPWFGRVYLNPPYGLIDGESSANIWSRKLVREFDAGRVTSAVLLANATTQCRWFQALVARFPACFVAGRIAFQTPGRLAQGPISGSALFYLGPSVSAFVETFSKFGAVVAPFERQAELPNGGGKP